MQSPPVRDISRVPPVGSDREHVSPDSNSNSDSDSRISLNGPALFAQKLRAEPLRASAGLFVEYGMFAAGVVLAALMFVTRHPLAFLDRKLDWHLRQSVIDLIARISPG